MRKNSSYVRRSALNLQRARWTTEPPRRYASLEAEWSLLEQRTRNSEDFR